LWKEFKPVPHGAVINKMNAVTSDNCGLQLYTREYLSKMPNGLSASFTTPNNPFKKLKCCTNKIVTNI